MSTYFDFKTINELTGDNYYRQPKEFTLEDLSQYDGSNGSPAYVAIEGIIYDISNTEARSQVTSLGLTTGQDLTSQFNSCNEIVSNAPKVGVLIDDNYMGDMNFRSTIPTNRQVKQDTSKFTPDDWIRYIDPLVTYALKETTQGMNTQRAYQKFILLGVLVGLGKTPQEAINQVQEWQNTGASQLLKSGTSSIGSTGTIGTGSIGKGVSDGIGMGKSTRTSDNTNKRNRLYFD